MCLFACPAIKVRQLSYPFNAVKNLQSALKCVSHSQKYLIYAHTTHRLEP